MSVSSFLSLKKIAAHALFCPPLDKIDDFLLFICNIYFVYEPNQCNYDFIKILVGYLRWHFENNYNGMQSGNVHRSWIKRTTLIDNLNHFCFGNWYEKQKVVCYWKGRKLHVIENMKTMSRKLSFIKELITINEKG